MVEDDGLLHSAGASSAAKDASEAIDAVSDTSECNVGIARGGGKHEVSWYVRFFDDSDAVDVSDAAGSEAALFGKIRSFPMASVFLARVSRPVALLLAH